MATKTEQKPVSEMNGIERANYAQPIIEKCEEEIEEGYRLPDEVVDVLWEIGMYQTFIPKECGGEEMDPIEWLHMGERLSAINGSIGWLAMNNCGFFMNYLPPEKFEEIKDEKGRYIHAMQIGRWGGMARKVEGGYKISGRWPFMSGAPEATYVGGASVLVDDEGQTVMHPDGLPWLIMGQWPAEQTTFIDTWDGLGLRGTGSIDMVVEDLFVPTDMVNEMGFHGLTYDRPMFRIRLLPVHAHASHALGLAQAALDEFTRIMTEKAAPGSIRKMLMGNEQIHQINYAKADSMVRSARLFTHQTVIDALENAEKGKDCDLEHKVLLRQAMVYTTQVCKEAVDLIFHMAGSSAVFRGRKLEKIFRDMATAWNHIITAEVELASCGSYWITRNMPGGPHLAGRKFL